MSVLIKGMEKPKNCEDCPLAGDFKCNLMPSIPALCKEYDMAVQNGKRLNNCPLVEIPPHGRLIDADKFLRLCEDYAITPSDNEFCKCLEFALTRVATIIEAEEDET